MSLGASERQTAASATGKITYCVSEVHDRSNVKDAVVAARCL